MEVLAFTFAIVLLLAVALFIFILKTRAFRWQLFRKEKELDQFAVDVRNWIAWKKERLESGGNKDENEIILPLEPLDEMQIQATLFTELRDAFARQKLYLDPELNLKAVIKILGTNKKYLYQAISENSDENFRAFINRYRVDEVKKIMENGMQNNEQINLSEMYASAGFNSSVSFYRAFKQVTGLTPRDYLHEMKSAMRNSGQEP